MNILKSGGTLFLAYEGRMGRASLLYSVISNETQAHIECETQDKIQV